MHFVKGFCVKLLFNYYTGRSPVRAEVPAGCGHSKIARVRAYYLYVLYVVAAAD